jgi:hypothetical protein
MNMNFTRNSVSPLAAALLVVASALALAINNQAAGQAFLCRVDFSDSDVTSPTAFYRIVSDGPRFFCDPVPSDHPLEGGAWDYWSTDSSHGYDPICPLVSGGHRNNVHRNRGGWMFSTGWSNRWIRINWKGALLSVGQTDPCIPNPAAPDLDSAIYAPNEGPLEKNPDPTVDHLVAGFTGNIFAPGVTRQSLNIEIYGVSGGSCTGSWALVYKQPLYVQQDDPANPRLVFVTTVNPNGNPAADVAEAELRHSVKPGRAVTIGTYKLPLTILVRQTDFPVQ